MPWACPCQRLYAYYNPIPPPPRIRIVMILGTSSWFFFCLIYVKEYDSSGVYKHDPSGWRIRWRLWNMVPLFFTFKNLIQTNIKIFKEFVQKIYHWLTSFDYMYVYYYYEPCECWCCVPFKFLFQWAFNSHQSVVTLDYHWESSLIQNIAGI